MATHDEETRRYFKHSSVQVLLCPRVAGKRHSWYKQTVNATVSHTFLLFSASITFLPFSFPAFVVTFFNKEKICISFLKVKTCL